MTHKKLQLLIILIALLVVVGLGAYYFFVFRTFGSAEWERSGPMGVFEGVVLHSRKHSVRYPFNIVVAKIGSIDISTADTFTGQRIEAAVTVDRGTKLLDGNNGRINLSSIESLLEKGSIVKVTGRYQGSFGVGGEKSSLRIYASEVRILSEPEWPFKLGPSSLDEFLQAERCESVYSSDQAKYILPGTVLVTIEFTGAAAFDDFDDEDLRVLGDNIGEIIGGSFSMNEVGIPTTPPAKEACIRTEKLWRLIGHPLIKTVRAGSPWSLLER